MPSSSPSALYLTTHLLYVPEHLRPVGVVPERVNGVIIGGDVADPQAWSDVMYPPTADRPWVYVVEDPSGSGAWSEPRVVACYSLFHAAFAHMEATLRHQPAFSELFEPLQGEMVNVQIPRSAIRETLAAATASQTVVTPESQPDQGSEV